MLKCQNKHKTIKVLTDYNINLLFFKSLKYNLRVHISYQLSKNIYQYTHYIC